MGTDEHVKQWKKLVERIEPMLSGKGPEVQGAVLVDLVATWLAGHHPDLRPEVLTQFMVTLVRLAAINEKLIFGQDGFPTGGLH
jgi:hypothetical protein